MKINTIILAPIAFLFGVASVLMLALILVQPSSIVYAQADSTEESSEQQIEASTKGAEPQSTDDNDSDETSVVEETEAAVSADASFEYVAQECDALTYMVRKSLNLFDDANDDISLSQEATIYAETNAVQEIGARLLDVGESVSIDSSLIEKYARSSQDLTPAQIQAWSAYTGNVDFALDNVVPVEDTTAAVTPKVEREEAANTANNSNQDGDGLSEADTVTPDDDDASVIWWVVGGGSVAGLWYLLYRRSDES